MISTNLITAFAQTFVRPAHHQLVYDTADLAPRAILLDAQMIVRRSS